MTSDPKATRTALVVLLRAKRSSMSAAEKSIRKKPAKWLYPWATEHHYVQSYRAWVKPVREFVHQFLAKHQESILNGDSTNAVIRTDAVAGESFALMVQSLNGWVNAYISDDEDKKLQSPIYIGLGDIADSAFNFNGTQYNKSMKTAIGISFPSDESWWLNARTIWQNANYEIIRSDIKKYIADINSVTEQAVTNGWSVKALADKIIDLDTKITKKRANFIARDQIGKLNGTVTQKRMQDAGLSMYVWDTSGDERVRDSHAVMEGLLCRWDDASVCSYDGGRTWGRRPAGAVLMHPGMDYQCRCCADAYFDELINEADGNTEWLNNESFIDPNLYSNKVISENEKAKVEEIRQKFVDNVFFLKGSNKYLDLDGVDYKSAKITYAGFERVFERYPKLKGKFYAVRSKVLPDNSFARTELLGIKRQVLLNRLFFKDYSILKKSYSKSVDNGLHPKGTSAISNIYHEIAHCIDDLLSNRMAVKLKGKFKTFSEYARIEVLTLTNKDLDSILNDVSIYAASDYREWFAECFAEALDSKEPSEMANALLALLDSVI